MVHQDQVYEADFIGNNQTRVFQLNRSDSLPGWCEQRSVDHDFGTEKNFLTLSISNNQLNCCSAENAIIKVYSLNGELLQTYGAQGRGDACQLYCPFISDDDDDGSVLIADYGNNRLQVMSKQGQFSVLQLQPPVSRPRSAVLFKNHLYVTSEHDKRIYKYSC